jgi:hypothetical protein
MYNRPTCPFTREKNFPELQHHGLLVCTYEGYRPTDISEGGLILIQNVKGYIKENGDIGGGHVGSHDTRD